MNWEKLSELKSNCLNAAAKAGEANGEKAYLPLWMHLTDTAGVMKKLFDERISAHEKELLTEAFGSEEKARAILEFIGGSHDIGKMTSIFQSSIQSHIPEYGLFRIPLLKRESDGKPEHWHHTWSGIVILLWCGFSENFSSVAGAHHGILQSSPFRGSQKNTQKKAQKCLNENVKTYFGRPNLVEVWESAWKGILSSLLQIAGIQLEDIPLLEIPVLMLISGILVEADWIASNTDYFPLIDLDSEGNPDVYPKRIETGWNKLNLPKPWRNTDPIQSDKDFQDLFGFAPNLMQKNVIEICKKVKEPGLFIIEAPMGLGKTEAALAAADIYSSKSGSGGILFGLPTQATANGLFPRFLQWASTEASHDRQILKMMHGGAAFNEDYGHYLNDSNSIDMDGGKKSLYLHDWMTGRKQGILSDFIIGTVDQAFMSALKHRHFMLRHAGLAGKTIIIDEVHAYDAYMNVYFDRMLYWMGLYKAPIILLSATLPVRRRQEMVMAYLRGRAGGEVPNFDNDDWLTSTAYPSLLWTDGLKAEIAGNMESGTSVEITIKKMDTIGPEIEEESLVNSLRECLSEGGCAGVIVNTVNRAQRIGEYLRSNLPDDQIIIFHSRFTAADRVAIEQEVISKVGKKSAFADRNKVIVVGTQVIEQSLDIDFDILYTELAPMDLLLQRMGRLHRHIRKDRPKKLNKSECFVLTGQNGEPDPAVKKIYDEYIQKQTLRYLPEIVSIPQDIPQLVNQVYRDFDPAVDSQSDEEIYLKNRLHENQSQVKASAHLLGEPSNQRLDKGLDGMMDPGDDFEADDQIISSVRDIEPAVSCLLFRETPQGFIVPAGSESWKGEWKAGSHPEGIGIKDFALQKITLPAGLPYEKTVSEIKKQMDQNDLSGVLPSLFKHDLILLLDQNGKIQLGNNFLSYSKEGLRIQRNKDN